MKKHFTNYTSTEYNNYFIGRQSRWRVGVGVVGWKFRAPAVKVDSQNQTLFDPFCILERNSAAIIRFIQA